jgi:hypothetical protein
MHKFITVFSNTYGIEDVVACHKKHVGKFTNFGNDFSTFSEADFKKMDLDDSGNIILFYRSLPTWLPVITKAKIVLVIVDDFPSRPWSKSTVDLRSMVHMVNRADAVVVRSKMEAAHVRIFMSTASEGIDKVISADPFYYQKGVFSETKITSAKALGEWNFKSASILVIGDPLDRRVTETLEAIRKTFPRTSHFDILQKGQFDEMSRSDIVVAISPHQEASVPYTLMTRASASKACIITDYTQAGTNGWDDCFYYYSPWAFRSSDEFDMVQTIRSMISNGMNIAYNKAIHARVRANDLMDTMASSIIERLR